jgi:hypothetical protein
VISFQDQQGNVILTNAFNHNRSLGRIFVSFESDTRGSGYKLLECCGVEENLNDHNAVEDKVERDANHEWSMANIGVHSIGINGYFRNG